MIIIRVIPFISDLKVYNTFYVLFLTADRMRQIDFGFNDKDVNSIDRIIEAVHELVTIIFIHGRSEVKRMKPICAQALDIGMIIYRYLLYV